MSFKFEKNSKKVNVLSIIEQVSYRGIQILNYSNGREISSVVDKPASSRIC